MDYIEYKKEQWKYSSCASLKAGAHFGHKSFYLTKIRFWHPLMSNYILGIRNGVSIINTIQTKQCLLKAFFLLSLILKKKGHILIVNTNPDFYKICKNFSILTLQNNVYFVYNNSNKYETLKSPYISYCCYKWVGGTLTNWKQISKSVLSFSKFSERCEPFLISNNIEFPKYKKIKDCFQGLLTNKNGKVFFTFNNKPDCIFLVNPTDNTDIINEAHHLHIPVIAFTESNCNIDGITHPIPINNKSINIIYYCLKKILKISLLANSFALLA